jgi:hypothetical protein
MSFPSSRTATGLLAVFEVENINGERAWFCGVERNEQPSRNPAKARTHEAVLSLGKAAERSKLLR